MNSEELGARPLRMSDYAALLAAILLALASWACLAGLDAIPAWKPWLSVAVGLLLALASLTKHPTWELRLKQVAALWIILAPWLFGFMYIRTAFWAYAAIGTMLLVTTVSAHLRRPATAM